MLENTIRIIIEHRVAFLNGLITTFELALVAWVVGLIVGALIGIAATLWRSADVIARSISFVISGVPILVFLFWLHYPAQSLLSISVDPFLTAAFMLSIINIIMVSEIVKNGIKNVPGQYLEVAKICGIGLKKRLVRIEFPLIIRHILPSLLLAQVSILHMTLFAGLISVTELFRISQRVISIEYKPVEIYTALGLFFLVISLPINGIALYMKSKFSRNLNER